MIKNLSIMFAALAAFLFFSCQLNQISNSTGELSLVLNDKVSRYLAPAADLEAVAFTIDGTGPAGQTVSANSSTWVASFDDLAQGSWEFTVSAFNSTGGLIGSNTGTVEIIAGELASLYINILPLTGTGTLDATLTWNPDDTFNPSITYSLAPFGTPVETAEGVIATEGIFTLNQTLPAGYYILSATLYDTVEVGGNPLKVYGGSELVRIVSGETTTGTISMSTLNSLEGAVAQVWNWTPNDPLLLTAQREANQYLVGEFATFSVFQDQGFPNVVYEWRMDGAVIPFETSNTIAVSQESPGFHRLDLMVFDPDSGRVGSITFEYETIPQPL